MTSNAHHSARVGMIGAGQLARMTQRAAIDLAVRLEVLAATAADPAVLVGAPFRIGSPLEVSAVTAFADGNDVITLDHELVSNAALQRIQAAGTSVVPDPEALRFAQDKLYARSQMASMGYPVPAFAQVDDVTAVEGFAARHGWPVVLKMSTMGYDGRGVEIVSGPEEAEAALAGAGVWVAEEMLDLSIELAVVVARRPSGDEVTYPVVETVQEDGICRELVMPARIDAELAESAIALARDVVAAIGAAGIVAVEMFVTTEGSLLINEFATRPHNSGHATIEGAITSQFHNHLRAALDWPLGSTELVAPAVAMVNVLGRGTDLAMANLPLALEVEGASVHLYGKEERLGRKIGHVTALGDSPDQALATARKAAAMLGGEAP
jgi:5-(carboxyamino)imidazole ribonucleotide synthase